MEMLRSYELVADWKNSNCGKITRGKMGGKLYFIKQYQTPVMPLNNGSLDERTFNANMQKFQTYVSCRTRLNQTIRSVAGAGGNIVIPTEEFIEGNHYMEVSEFIDGVVPDDELEGVLASLSPDVKKLLMLTAAGALGTVHAQGIIHSDLKLENVLLVRNSTSGNYVAKIIDFDSSYFADNIPDEVVGDIRYFSPELATYSDEEDDKESLKSTLTPKSDIFSLGIIFHRYLTGEFPEAVSLTERLQRRKEAGKPVYCWSVLLNGCELKVSDAVPAAYKALIEDMLSKDPTKRPTAMEVMRRLKGFGSTSASTSTVVTIEEPWPAHSIMLDKTKIKNEGNVSLKKKEVAGKQVYELTDKNGRKVDVTKEELIAKGYATTIEAREGFDPCWDGHNFTWKEDKLRARGFVAATRKEQAGIKGYELYRTDSTATFFTKEKLAMMGYTVIGGATSSAASSTSSSSSSAATATVTTFCEPWPEHNIELDVDAIKSKGYVGVAQGTMAGVKGYLFYTASGEPRFMKVEMMCMIRLAKRK